MSTKTTSFASIFPAIMCGGSGTRLWPLSRALFPKQFLPLVNDTSMLQDTLKRLPKNSNESVFICNEEHRFLVAEQVRQLSQSQGTILLEPEGRNCGVKASSGKILVFLDADVKLTQQWQNNIDRAIKDLDENPLIITGSRCSPPENNNTLNSHWFNLLVESNSVTYINSGHLITSKKLFDKISGFNEDLRTAEDHDFCIRASQLSALIISNPDLKVFHDGYPTTYAQFIKRERWHGREDFKSVTSLLKSKVALVICLHLLIFISSILMSLSTEIIYGVFSYIISMTSLSVLLTIYKFNLGAVNSLIKTSFIHYLYIIGRTCSLLDRVTCRYSAKFR